MEKSRFISLGLSAENLHGNKVQQSNNSRYYLVQYYQIKQAIIGLL